MKNNNILIAVIIMCLALSACQIEKSPQKVIKAVYSNAMHSEKSYEMLRNLCTQAPGRLPGTSQSEKAIAIAKETLIKNGADSVWLIPVNSTGWKELNKPISEIILANNQRIFLNSVSLGQCTSTSGGGIDAPIVVISEKKQIDSLGEAGIKGKIVFFNGKMKVRTDYGKMNWQRTQGASLVSKYGALAVVIRSLTTKYDNNPHTGVVRYDENLPEIPAVAISWQSADTLELYLNKYPDLKIHLETFCENPGFIPSFNVIGEIRGSEYPNDIFLLTGHMDAWFNAQGAQDDGGGISQIIDVIRIFKELKIKPKHTLRIMPYMDEEQFNTGIKYYAKYSSQTKQTNVFEIEVDYGSGIPVGYNIESDSVVFTNQDIWRKYIAPYQINNINFSNSYDESWPLYDNDKTILSHLVCKDDHYFDYHHSANDIFESVDKKNLQSGSAALAAFIYILDKMDVIDNSNRKLIK